MYKTETGDSIALLNEIKRIDWLFDFVHRYKDNEMIANLKRIEFCGKVEVHFGKGMSNACHVNWCVQPYGKVTLIQGTKGGDGG